MPAIQVRHRPKADKPPVCVPPGLKWPFTSAKPHVRIGWSLRLLVKEWSGRQREVVEDGAGFNLIQMIAIYNRTILEYDRPNDYIFTVVKFPDVGG